MDSVKIGKVIHELRKNAGMTQAQLAEKLMVSDKAVSKWELGASIPDIQQLESITQLFNISYDLLLSGDLEKVKLTFVKNKDAKPLVKKKLSSREWYKLDNAALVYPSQSQNNWNSVFRVSAVMKEDVDIEILNKALHDLVERFPTFMVCLKKGFFWYYLERREKYPVVESGDKHPNRPIKLDGKHYLFRVIVDVNRVAVEVFHSVTDTHGATVFLISLLSRYYELRYGQIKEFKGALNALDIVNAEEVQDSYELYATNNTQVPQKLIKNAYHIKDKKIKDNIVTHLVVDSNKLKSVANKYNCSISVLLAALYTKAFLKKKFYDRDPRSYIIQMPVNLRNIFPSKSLRNFSLFTAVEITESELAIDELIETIKKQLDDGREKENLKNMINIISSYKNNLAIRLLPRPLKDIAIKAVAKVIGNLSYSTVFDDLGIVEGPEELKSIVDRIELVMKEDREGGISMSSVIYNEKCDITFVRSIEKSMIERDVARDLVEMGIDVFAEGNGGASNEKV